MQKLVYNLLTKIFTLKFSREELALLLGCEKNDKRCRKKVKDVEVQHLLSTSILIFPYYQGDPTIFNKLLYPHLEITKSFEGIIILHSPLFCLSFKQFEGGCGITRTNFI